MQNQSKKVLIIGAGIGGPALALFLRRAGIAAEMYEAREEPEGYALTLASNGVAVMQELGLASATYAEGSAVMHSATITGRGRDLGEITMAGGGLKSVFIKRVPFGLILTDEVERQGIPIMRGKKLQNVAVTEAGGVVATFQDGSSASGDILIGCDGVRSQTRHFVDPAFPGPVYTDLINCGGYTSGMLRSSPPETTYFVFGKLAFFGYHANPTTGYVYWWTNWPHEQEPTRGEFDHLTDADRRQEMLAKYTGELPVIQQIIQKADETYPYFLSYTLPQQPATWHRGPVEPAILVAATAFALALPLEVAGLFLLRLEQDLKQVRFEEEVAEAFQEIPFTGSEQVTSPSIIEGRRRRRTRIILFNCLGILALSLILTVTGMVAALWHIAWWIGVLFLVMVLLSQGIVMTVLNTSQPPNRTKKNRNAGRTAKSGR